MKLELGKYNTRNGSLAEICRKRHDYDGVHNGWAGIVQGDGKEISWLLDGKATLGDARFDLVSEWADADLNIIIARSVEAREIVSIVGDSLGVIAFCNDGSLWGLDRVKKGGWTKLPPIPQPEESKTYT